MNDAVSGNGEAPVLDFFEIDDRPVVVNRNSDAGWVWSVGAWQGDNTLVERCYSQGRSLSQEVFVHRFPYAALALLDAQPQR